MMMCLEALINSLSTRLQHSVINRHNIEAMPLCTWASISVIQIPEFILVFLGQRVFAFVILTDTNKSPSVGILLIQISTSNI